jgi:hypothetical protein
MKAYGHSRRDKLECKYGCCTGKSGKVKACRKVVDRTHRKTARQVVEVVEDTEVLSMSIFGRVHTWYERGGK